jgi:hypothetical protein
MDPYISFCCVETCACDGQAQAATAGEEAASAGGPRTDPDGARPPRLHDYARRQLDVTAEGNLWALRAFARSLREHGREDAAGRVDDLAAKVCRVVRGCLEGTVEAADMERLATEALAAYRAVVTALQR